MKLSFVAAATTLFLSTMGVMADDTYTAPSPADSSLGLSSSLDGTYGVVIEDYTESYYRKAKRDTISNLETHCSSDGALEVTLSDGVLTDANGRIGSIVSNNQFQFDGPPPQSDYIYAAGWAVDDDGILYLGEYDDFYKCLSGDFYNLYYQSIDNEACTEVQIKLVSLTDC
ncbi:unnamed protein product [Ambrosiozyma monospora]|uniref:Unnamed protein product n=1 Tax=Ambrosiozyma monospora TaxID=43982 RepID=A0ACB5T4C4_AMBMO|nr:unnamed protein product [Ambrosiozyma monospora]